MSSILITGAGSFIGESFIRYSVHKNVRTISVKENLPSSEEFEGIDTIFHVAAIVHSGNKIDPGLYSAINRDLAVETAKRAKAAGVRHFIFMSTSKVNGDFKPGSAPFNENSECRPVDNYGKSKLEAEAQLKMIGDEDFCVSIVRTPVVYGVGMKANMLNLLKLVNSMPLLPLNGINNKRQYTYVENLIGFIDRIIDLRVPGTFIAMDTEACSTTDLVKYMASALNKKLFLFPMPFAGLLFRKISEKLYGSFEINNNLTREILSFEPVFSTKEGLRKMVSEYHRLNKISRNEFNL
jgi:UDP-glucose 4-epimerase